VPAPGLRQTGSGSRAPGFGWSDAPGGSYSKPTFCRDVLGLLDAEGLDTVRLMGHDWGGFTSCLLALEHPERIQRMVALRGGVAGARQPRRSGTTCVCGLPFLQPR
jgi:pimeloyl-ACP methyl ester carboxylesterase